MIFSFYESFFLTFWEQLCINTDKKDKEVFYKSTYLKVSSHFVYNKQKVDKMWVYKKKLDKQSRIGHRPLFCGEYVFFPYNTP